MTADSGAVFELSVQGLTDDGMSLFENGFHREAIRHEAQDLLIELADRSGRSELEGQNLIQAVLSDKDPVLALSELTTAKERNQHASLRHLLLGVTTGVRNVYSHDVRSDVTREEAAMWLTLLARLRDQIEQLDVPTAFGGTDKPDNDPLPSAH